MTLNGMLHTHIRQHGRMLLKAITTLVIISLLLSGCSANWWVGDGRGDWTIDLCAGYSISKINSREILFGYKKNPEDPGRTIIISNYFVTAYQMYDPYILLEGIQTERITISDEEQNRRVLSYYLIDTTDGKVSGPFETYDDFVDYCSSLALKIKDEWTNTDN